MLLLREFMQTFSPNIKNDVLSGLTVALALVPEAVAFAFVATRTLQVALRILVI